MRRVIKFGGTSLASAELVRAAAEHVARLVEYGEQIAVVVSAPGNTTTELLEAIYGVSDNQVSFIEASEFAALGEEQSVYLVCAALRNVGIAAEPYLPHDKERWPIIANCEDLSPLATAKVNEERPFRLDTQQTVSRFRRFVLPQLRVGTVPVIAGFFAVDSTDRIVALGRGGSDITAFIVATQIYADEVVIVTDVQGVLSADPRLAENPHLLAELSLEDLQAIASAGTRVLHPRALKYKSEQLRVRLADYRELDRLEESGTSVLGRSETTIHRNAAELSRLTLVGDPGELERMQRVLCEWQATGKIAPAAVSMSSRFVCYFLPTAVAEESYRELHGSLSASGSAPLNLSLMGGIGELRLRSAQFVDDTGGLAELTGLLANNRIKTIEVVTGLTDISVFVPYEDLDRAETLLRRALEHYAG